MKVTLGLLCLLSVSLALAGPAIDDRLNTICRDIRDPGACADAIENFQLSRQTRRVVRSGDHLSIELASGRRVTLTDRSAQVPEVIAYRYIQYLPSIGFHLVHVQYYEGTEMLLVSNVDGGRYFIPDVPRVSPDGTMIVAVSASEAFNANGVFVYRLHEGTLSPIFWHEPEEYALYSFSQWKDENSIELRKFTYADQKICPGSRFMTIGVVLSMKQGRWKFVPDGGRAQCQ